MSTTRTRIQQWWTSNWGYWLPPIAWMGVIFLLSSRADYPNLMPQRPDLQNILGHLVEYGVLTALLVRAFSRLANKNHASLWTLGVVMLYAASDEWHQTFVPGRKGDPLDWVVDVIAALLVLSLRRWWTRRQKRRDLRRAQAESKSHQTAPAARR